MSSEKPLSEKMKNWVQPKGLNTGIKIFNSLTLRKDEFCLRGDVRKVNMYVCGPTVYDKSHMGHARTYIGFDVCRRILEDYFQIPVVYVVNITDIDDKIIRKANIELLTKLQKAEPKGNMTIADVVQNISKLNANKEEPDFEGISRYYEKLFWEDMNDLQVRMPTAITRVTEYVPVIIAFIEQIMKNGYAYESNGSVYFDTKKFNESPSHSYGKLEPWSTQNLDLLQEGEGEWSLSNKEWKLEKRNPSDFALWKKSMVGEPRWKSPWGEGRPGWHIECSAMASHVLGKDLDIHCGGIDLRFPHHDNEISQSEAYFDCDQWVNYFMHAGHLNIDGLKMAKSLKNFVTIRKALEHYNSRHIRWLFLLHRINDPLDYSEETMKEAIHHDKTFNEFFQNVKVYLRTNVEHGYSAKNEQWRKEEFDFFKIYMDKKLQIHEALLDNFDTPRTIKLLLELLTTTNQLMFKNNGKPPLVREVGLYVTKMLKIFGLDMDRIGFSVGDTNTKTTSSSGADAVVDSGNGGDNGNFNFESQVQPILDVFVRFREQVRKIAREKKDVGILQICDSLRDADLMDVGVRLEDKGEKSVWKLEDPVKLSQERKLKQEEEEKRMKEREEIKKKQLEKEQEKKQKDDFLNNTDPKDYFRKKENLHLLGVKVEKMFGKWSDDGIPTHFEDGSEVSANMIKQLKKIQQKATK